jgi:type III pantothenate kinase
MFPWWRDISEAHLVILEVDMGNTRLKWRVRDGQTNVAQGFIGIESSFDLLKDELDLYRHSIKAVWVASVVGDLLEQRLVSWAASYLNMQPRFARSTAACGGVRNGYDKPQTLGVDRWLGLIAAYACVGRACLVASFGTAITLDLVAEDGEHLGGYIAPGINLMQDSLAIGTRQIKLDKEVGSFDLAPATATANAIYSACAAMLVGLLANGVEQLRNGSSSNDIEIIFTGGDAIRLLPFFPQARLIPGLVLDGLACVLGSPQRLEQ